MSIGLPARMGGVLSVRGLSRQLLPIAIAGLCVIAVLDRMDGMDMAGVGAALGAVTPWQWLAAGLATLTSFVAVGQYDALFHGWLRTGVPRRRAAASGAAAIALAQVLGLGLVTGTIARWRALPDLSLALALKITNYVSFSFMAALGLVSVAFLALPGAAGLGAPQLALVAASAALASCIFSFAYPRLLPFALPPLRLVLRLVLLTAADIAFAALALWLLLPTALQPEFPLLLAAFALALGAGLLSGSPGGVGPFELCLLTLLPTLPEHELLAAILAFRLVYYALPAGIAVCLLIRPVQAHCVKDEQSSIECPAIRRAEANLATLPGHAILPCGRGTALHVADTGQTLVALGDRVCGTAVTTEDLAFLDHTSGDRSLWPMLYKCSARSAAAARHAGWTVVRLSEEAWLSPADFTLQAPTRRQLRRKLARVRKTGVTVERARTLPLAEMARVAREWSRRAGGERGFSMGRFTPEYVSDQRCYLAWRGEELTAFATFHRTAEEWCLDLMRSEDGAPDGTMQALLVSAIADAEDDGIPRLSLAAMPLARPHPVLRWLAQHFSGDGLRQFKKSFDPRRSRLYAAAPNPAVLALAGIDVALCIHNPDRLTGPGVIGADTFPAGRP